MRLSSAPLGNISGASRTTKRPRGYFTTLRLFHATPAKITNAITQMAPAMGDVVHAQAAVEMAISPLNKTAPVAKCQAMRSSTMSKQNAVSNNAREKPLPVETTRTV